jgi:hypothetical protein
MMYGILGGEVTVTYLLSPVVGLVTPALLSVAALVGIVGDIPQSTSSISIVFIKQL